MMVTENVGALLTDLKKRVGGLGTALVSRNGGTIAADLPAGVTPTPSR